MELEKAFMSANDEDNLYHSPGYKFKRKDFYKQSISGQVIFSREWKIIKPEPKVLTVKEWLDKHLPAKWKDDRDSFELACEFFQRNGRLERDKELRPLIKEIKKYIEKEYSPGSWTSVFSDELKNLKPLNDEI